jgi:hypothetical protein
LNADWTEQDWLRPERLEMKAGPDIDEAHFVLEVGNFTHRRDTPFDISTPYSGVVEPLSIDRHYVKIEFMDADDQVADIWVGRLAYEEQITSVRDVDGQNVKTGVQRFVAYGLLWEWENTIIASSFVRPSDGSSNWLDPERGIPFNLVEQAGGYALRGNLDPASISPPVFSWKKHSETFWTAKEAIEYLCRFFPPKNPAGNEAIGIDPTGAVLTWYDISVETDRRSVKAVLDELVDRRRLAGYWLKPKEVGSSILCDLILFTFTETDIEVGEDVITANPDQIELVIRGDKILESCILRSVATHVCDRIVVEGTWITSTLSVTFGEGALEKGWTNGNEGEFLAGAGGVDEDQNTLARSRDELKDVFARIVTPSDWDQLLDGNVAVTVQPESFPDDMDSGDVPGLFNDPDIPNPWRHLASRYLDYIAIQDANSKEFRRPFVVFPESQLGGNYWVYSDQAAQIDRQFSCHLHMLHDTLGFVQTVSKAAGNSLLALNHWAAAAPAPDELDPDDAVGAFDYEDLIFTGTLEWDDRVSAVVIINSTGDGTERVRYIRVEDARLDFVVPGTITDINADGELIVSTGSVLRDDRSRLQKIATAAAAWYGVPRRAVTLTYNSMRQFVTIGQLVTDFVDNFVSETVNTPITGIAIDFNRGTTTLETSYAEADFSSNRVGV